jgi:LacI family transcriptional regulator
MRSKPLDMDVRAAVSIQDVADAAKVSIATVSRVLNNPHLVASETAQRVQSEITRLGYVPNAFAQGLIKKVSRVLGIALPDLHGEFYSELLRGADTEARRRGYHLLVSSEARHGGSPAVSGGVFGLIDGLAIMLTEPDERLWKETRGMRLPTVVLDADIDAPHVDRILVDNAAGTHDATRHLLENVKGDKLFFVGGPKENFDTKRRAEEFTRTLRAAGVQLRQDEIAYGRYSTEWGHAWATARVQMQGVTSLKGAGVLAGNDEIALGVLQAAQDAGLHIPRDLRIVGFDDTRIASMVRPRLSTVRVPLVEVGEKAVQLLVERIDDPRRPAAVVHLPTRLIIRESSGK